MTRPPGPGILPPSAGHAPARAHPGCRCRECYGLAEHMADTTGRTYGLPAAPGHTERATLTVVTMGPDPSPACTGAMTCTCPTCTAERVGRVQSPPRTPRQPWETAA